MNIAVVYATNSGTTARCAGLIAERLGAELFDVSKKRRHLDISAFDAVVVGSPVRMGGLHNGALRFLSENKSALLEKKLAVFICNGYPEHTDDYFENLFPRSLLEHCVWYGSLGGELVLERLPFMDRLMMKQVVRGGGELPDMHVDAVKLDELVHAML